jgi:predicted amino acid dehydrogenase
MTRRQGTIHDCCELQVASCFLETSLAAFDSKNASFSIARSLLLDRKNLLFVVTAFVGPSSFDLHSSGLWIVGVGLGAQ